MFSPDGDKKVGEDAGTQIDNGIAQYMQHTAVAHQ